MHYNSFIKMTNYYYTALKLNYKSDLLIHIKIHLLKWMTNYYYTAIKLNNYDSDLWCALKFIYKKDQLLLYTALKN